ncbi:MAG: transcription termination factor Rho [Planctomycetota bacterium]
MTAQDPSPLPISKGRRSEIIDLRELQRLETDALVEKLNQEGLEVPAQAQHNELILRLLAGHAKKDQVIYGEGVLEVLPDGFGFLRSVAYNYVPGPDDIYVSPSQIRRFGLKKGNRIGGQLRPPKNNEKYFALLKVEHIDGVEAEKKGPITPFENLTPLYPREQVRLEIGRNPLANRVLDLLSPIGKGQRGLIVAPPKAGKTMLLQAVATGILANHPEVYVIVLLVDERPEEVTEMRTAVQGPQCEVAASTFDEPPSAHAHTAEMVLEKARRMVESGVDVVILLDSITRMARAYNIEVPSSGKLLSGGMDPAALQKPKRFFGSARNIDRGGSLTILGTTLIDTGSRMDEVIFEEFKGTGNMEVVLDRGLADKRIYPAIDVKKTGTRREELLLPKEVIQRVWVLRRVLSSLQDHEATELERTRERTWRELLLEKLRKSESNAEFLATLSSN